MIICQNCGTTNNENVSRVCRTCGALLPVPTKHSKVRQEKVGKEKKKVKKPTKKPTKDLNESEKKKKDELKLQEIPKEHETVKPQMELEEIPSSKENKLESNSASEYDSEIKESGSKGLQEITPQPFRGSILDTQKKIFQPSSLTDSISDAFSELKNSIKEKGEDNVATSISPAPMESNEAQKAILKQRQLEKDMTEVLGFLSKKISVKKLEIVKKESKKEDKHEEKIPPSSMNEILKQLLNLDLNIEATAIIKTDGTILASAISSRISESLFATIGMNLSMIGSDIIEGLSGGVLKSISVRGSEGVVDLAPIDRTNPNVKDMLLILFSHPKVKSGIISFAVNIVKKQLKEYLGLS
jgi:predicted regulator of Ras-like GTPase activity (Roadblock/LC7/MglB family)